MNRFKNILVFVGTKDPASAIHRAFQIAHENDANVTLIDVLKPIPKAMSMLTKLAKPADMDRLLRGDRQTQMEGMLQEMGEGDAKVEVCVRTGDPAQEITRRVLEQGHDLVLKTADGGIFGSTARSLMRLCPCPVWVLKPQVHGEFNQVVAAVDLDPYDDSHLQLNSRILELAYSVAQRDNATLHVVNAWEMWIEKAMHPHAAPSEIDSLVQAHEAAVQKTLDELLQAPVAHADDVVVHLERGGAADVIWKVAQEVEADLIVMGTQCRTGVPGFLIGNTAETVLGEADCSLLTIKPQSFTSPMCEKSLNKDSVVLI